MMKSLLMVLVLSAASLPALAAAEEPDAVACPTQRDLYEFLNAADRNDAGRVHFDLAAVIVMLDVEEVDRLGGARHVVKLAQIAAERGIVPDLP